MSDAEPKAKRIRKTKKVELSVDTSQDAGDPLAIVHLKRVRAVAATRKKKEKALMRLLHVDDAELQESFDIPAHFHCSSCKQPHSISEHVQARDAHTSRVYQTCQSCRDKGIEFYRRQLRYRAVDDNKGEEEKGTGTRDDSIEVI